MNAQLRSFLAVSRRQQRLQGFSDTSTCDNHESTILIAASAEAGLGAWTASVKNKSTCEVHLEQPSFTR